MLDQRRSRRVLKTLPLEILANGEVIPATTAVINLNGALILCSVKWPQGSELKFRNAENGVLAAARLYGRKPDCSWRYETAESKQPTMSFAGMRVTVRKSFARFHG